jgi:hypothetical protein
VSLPSIARFGLIRSFLSLPFVMQTKKLSNTTQIVFSTPHSGPSSRLFCAINKRITTVRHNGTHRKTEDLVAAGDSSLGGGVSR